MTASTTVRVTPETRERLRRLAERRGMSTPAVVEQLARREEDRDEVREWGDALRALSGPALAAYREESAGWDDVSADDGLDAAAP